MSAPRLLVLLSAMNILHSLVAVAADSLPEPKALPEVPGVPAVLTAFDGSEVRTREQWLQARAPELRRLFTHYEYGMQPPRPARVQGRLLHRDPAAFGGRATLREVEVSMENPSARVKLLLVTPNGASGPVPCFLGMNFKGNHTLVDDPGVALAQVPPGGKEGVRGSEAQAWSIERVVSRGYAVASFYNSEVVPDHAGLAPERLRELAGKGADPEALGTVAAWAWSLSRMVDFLEADAAVDAKRIAVVGHSRNGKTALLAAAMDERIAMVIPSQAGCGGTAPCRVPAELLGPVGGRPVAETVAVINRSFPHWFCGNFKAFGEAPQRLPFDQHALIALCAPRPVLVSNATEDRWANPAGQFAMVLAAEPVYRLLCGEGCDVRAMPEEGRLVASRLGYFIRPGKHSMDAVDWAAWLDYADRWLKASGGR